MSFSVKFILVAGIAFSLLAAGQTPSKPLESADAASDVGAAQPVITVRGLCAHGQAKAKDAAACIRTMNRKQFDALVNALNPDGVPLPVNGRRYLARTYTEYLAVEAAARDSGLEDTVEFRELMEYLRLKTITEMYRRKMQEKYRTPTPEEITAYYKQHLSDYETVKVVNILIPKGNPPGQDKGESDKKAHEAAELARQRLLKGEDPVQIQKDSYSALGLTTPPPATELGNLRRSQFSKAEGDELFSLKPGEVSQIVTGASNYVIYKLISKDVTPEEKARNDISQAIYQKNFREAMKAVIGATTAEFNEQYFRPDTPPAGPPYPQPGPHLSSPH